MVMAWCRWLGRCRCDCWRIESVLPRGCRRLCRGGGSLRSMIGVRCGWTSPRCSPRVVRRSLTSTRLRQQTPLLGPVASAPTVWRSLNEASPAALNRVEKARAKVRCHVWSLLSQPPASKVAGIDLGEVVVLDVDATLVTCHSEKEQAAATFKGGFGFHPIGVWCDNTTELLAISLR